MEYLSELRVHLTYELPLAEIVLDYYDQLKSRTRGYASFDYDVSGFQPGNLARVDILVGGEPVDALSLIIHRDFAYERGKLLVEKLREEIPRQMFDVAIQAAIGARIIARETVKARRKDVLAKCYGGDITRKRKLLEKQKKARSGSKRSAGVEVPQEAFLAVLNLNEPAKRIASRSPSRQSRARRRRRRRRRPAGARRPACSITESARAPPPSSWRSSAGESTARVFWVVTRWRNASRVVRRSSAVIASSVSSACRASAPATPPSERTPCASAA